VYQSDGSLVTNPHTVIGRVTATGPTVTVTFSGSAVFSSSSSYQCAVSKSTIWSFGVTYLSGSQFMITNTSWGDTFAYICTGN
jgi:hypothetical protein